MINTVDGRTVVIPMLKISGMPYTRAAPLAWANGFLSEPVVTDEKSVYTFNNPLKAPPDMQQYLEELWKIPKRII